MDALTVVTIAGCIFVFGLVSRRIEQSPFTAPMIFAGAGFLAGPACFGLVEGELGGEASSLIIELTLVLVLFTDASRIRFSELRSGYHLPARLLLIGLPLTIAAGALVAMPLFPALALAEVGLLAAVLAPTDAALGQVVVSSERVPVRIRQALNVESGLNDGIAVPVVMLLLAAAVSIAGEPSHEDAGASGLGFAAAQVGLGPIAGLIALPGGWLVERAVASKSMNAAYQHFAGLAIALGAFATAELIGGNGFIAAFTAGLVIGNTAHSVCASMQEFAEDEGQLLALIAFFVFGVAMLPEALGVLDAGIAVYILCSLTVVRMLPVALALIGAGLKLPSVLFLGWFGPRGLATILFALLVSEAEAIPHHELISQIAILSVAASILAHGWTASPLAQRYGRWVAGLQAVEAELRPVPELPVRLRSSAQRQVSTVRLNRESDRSSS